MSGTGRVYIEIPAVNQKLILDNREIQVAVLPVVVLAGNVKFVRFEQEIVKSYNR